MSFHEILRGVPKDQRKENRQLEAEIRSLEVEYKRIEGLAKGRPDDRQLQDQLFSARSKWGERVSAYNSYKRAVGLKSGLK